MSKQPLRICTKQLVGVWTDCRYYQGLSVLQSHFPIGRKTEGVPVEFTWYDAFQPNKKGVSNSITYEKASVLFNLAAVCSQESLSNDLTTDGGLKASARHFQVSSPIRKLSAALSRRNNFSQCRCITPESAPASICCCQSHWLPMLCFTQHAEAGPA